MVSSRQHDREFRLGVRCCLKPLTLHGMDLIEVIRQELMCTMDGPPLVINLKGLGPEDIVARCKSLTDLECGFSALSMRFRLPPFIADCLSTPQEKRLATGIDVRTPLALILFYLCSCKPRQLFVVNGG